MNMKKKPLPVGMDLFEKIISNGYYYVDKTLFIKSLIESAGEVNLFTRPRRFGKSLIMSTLKSFFEIGSDPELFNGLAIEQEKELCGQYQGKYPVISISLKGIEGETYESALKKLKFLISTECKRLCFLSESSHIDCDDKALFELLRTRKGNEEEMGYSLATIMRMLHAHYGKKVILLIDEYDVPLDKSSENGYYDRMILFMRTFFGEAFKTNPDLQFAVVTGCLRISKESIFTGINNLYVDSISDYRFNEYFGFTDEDVKTILKDYDLCNAYEEMREWYDGYYFGDTDVYCPWDIINHCKKLLDNPKAEPKAYWNNSSSNAIVRRFIDKADKITRDDIERLVAGEAIEKKITEYLTYSELDESIDNLWSVLYLTGYLTLDRKKEAQNPDFIRLVIPNKEVRAIFIDKIRGWFGGKIRRSYDKMNEMYDALARGDVEKAEKIISSQLRSTISYYDHYENFYHGFMTGLLSANPTWSLRSNREAGLGRSDITLEDEQGEFGIVIEIKQADSIKTLDIKCDEALGQIEEKEYAEPLMDEVDEIWMYGIAFAGKRCRMKGKKVK